MHLRRALLLFAIVLGLAAMAASVSRPRDESRRPSSPSSAERTEPTVKPQPATGPSASATVTLEAGPRGRARIETGEAVTLEVTVDEAGLVEIPELGLNAAGDSLTAARFEIFTRETGRYEVRFTPAGRDGSEIAGTLVVTEPAS